MKSFLLGCLFLLAYPDADSKRTAEQTGTVIRIVDGDTFDLLTTDKKVMRIRMYGIDCPERKQDFYQAAKNALSRYIFKKEILVKITGYDRNRRSIAIIYCNGQNINLVMIKNGFAWHFSKYLPDINFAQAEKQARMAKAGLWKNPGPVAPWEFRKRRQHVGQHLFSNPGL